MANNDVVLRVVAEKGGSVDQVITGIQSQFQSMAESARAAVQSMTLGEARGALTELISDIGSVGKGFVDAAKDVAAVKRELSTVTEGADLERTVNKVRELSLHSNYSAREVADLVRQMRNLGPVTDESLSASMNIAAATGISLQTMGRNFQIIAEGGQSAERVMKQMARQAGITVEQLRAAGAEVSGGKLLTDTPEQAEKARQALIKLGSTGKWADAAQKMQSATDLLNKSLEHMKADIGEQAAAWEAWASKGLAVAILVLDNALPKSLQGAVGIIADLTGRVASGVGSLVQFGASVAQVAAATYVYTTAQTARTAATQSASTADTVASQQALAAAQARFTASASHAQAALAAEAEAVAQQELAAEYQFAAAAAMEEGEVAGALAVELQAAAAVAEEEALILQQLAAAHAADAIAAEQQAVAEGQAATASSGLLAALTPLRLMLGGLVVAEIAAAGYIGIFGDIISQTANEAIKAYTGIPHAFTSMAEANQDAEDKITDSNRNEIRALGEHRDMIGKTAGEYRQMGKTAADVTDLVLELRAKLEELRKGGASKEEQDKVIAQIMLAIGARTQLAESEGAVRQATLDTAAALATAEHGYKLNTVSVQNLMAAQRDRITKLGEEITAQATNQTKREELIKQQRAVEEQLYQTQRQAADEAFAREKSRYDLGKTGYMQLVQAARDHVATLEREGARETDILKAKLEVIALTKKQLREELEVRREIVAWELKQARSSIDFSSQLAREKRQDAAKDRVDAAQSALDTAKQVQSYHAALQHDSLQDVARVREAEIKAARTTHDQKVQIAEDERARVVDAERSKVLEAKSAWESARDDYERLAASPGANADDLRQARLNQEQARRAWADAWQSGNQAIVEANRKMGNEIADNDLALTNKRKAIDADYELTRIATTKRIRDREIALEEGRNTTRMGFLASELAAMREQQASGKAVNDDVVRNLQEQLALKLRNIALAAQKELEVEGLTQQQITDIHDRANTARLEALRAQRAALKQILEEQQGGLKDIQAKVGAIKQLADQAKQAGGKGAWDTWGQSAFGAADRADQNKRDASLVDALLRKKGLDSSEEASLREALQRQGIVLTADESLAQSHQRTAGGETYASLEGLRREFGVGTGESTQRMADEVQKLDQQIAALEHAIDGGLQTEVGRLAASIDSLAAAVAGGRGGAASAANAPGPAATVSPAPRASAAPSGGAAAAGFDWARQGSAGFDWARDGRGGYDWARQSGPTDATPWGGTGALPEGYRTDVRPHGLPEQPTIPDGFYAPRPDVSDASGSSSTVIHATNFISMGGGLAPAPVQDAMQALNEQLTTAMTSPNRWGQLGVT